MNASNQTIHSNTTFYKWKAEPTTRGSFSIISSCLITMTLCVWTSVHLNLPEYMKPREQTWRKVKWLIIALFAPELVAVIAYAQYKQAWSLSIYMRMQFDQEEPVPWWRRVLSFRLSLSSIFKSFGTARRAIHEYLRGDCKLCVDAPSGWHFHPSMLEKHQEESPLGKRHKWTQCHSFYALMGGFAISTENVEENFLPGNRRRMALTIDGIHYVVEKDKSSIPDISEAEIKDKSKASDLTKSIVCLQATWFCLQCCTRWIKGLTVSLLELNTFGHALCALLIYLFWWDKPLDIERPSLLHGKDIQPLGDILVYHYYNQNKERFIAETLLGFTVTKRFARLSLSTMDPLSESPRNLSEIDNNQTEQNLEDTDLEAGNDLRGFQFHGYYHKSLQGGGKTLKRKRLFLRLSAKEVRLRKRVFDASEYHEFLNYRQCLIDRVSNAHGWKSTNRIYSKGLLDLSFIGFVLSGLFYGGLHLTAWNESYRSTTEEILWKVSALIISGFGFLFIAILATLEMINRIPLHIRGGFELLACILLLACLGYTFARIYLVIESFLGLTHLSESAFIVPNWTNFLPHVT